MGWKSKPRATNVNTVSKNDNRNEIEHYIVEKVEEHDEHYYIVHPICKHGLKIFQPAGTAITLCNKNHITIKELVEEITEIDPLSKIREKDCDYDHTKKYIPA